MMASILSEEKVHEIERICNQVRKGTVLQYVPSNVIDDLIFTLRDRDKTIAELNERIDRMGEVGLQNDELKRRLNEFRLRVHQMNQAGSTLAIESSDLEQRIAILRDVIEWFMKNAQIGDVHSSMITVTDQAEIYRRFTEALAKVNSNPTPDKSPTDHPAPQCQTSSLA